ncbi:MAG: MarR family transcriptional regulator [Acidobacteriales bacterium]|nr:MarR family transcriptional regulator [Terriglobales bacterium]
MGNRKKAAAAAPVYEYDPGGGLRVWLILFRAAQAMEKNALASIAGLKLGLSDFAVLEMLLHRGPLPVNVIGQKILLASASITAAVDRLEKKKLVRRRRSQSDGRSRLVELTAAGRKVVEPALAQHAADMEEIVKVLGPRERKELVRLLKKLGLWAAAKAESVPYDVSAGKTTPLAAVQPDGAADAARVLQVLAGAGAQIAVPGREKLKKL